MKQVHVSTRGQWRRWLAENHDEEEEGIWLELAKFVTAKRLQTRARRVKETLPLLAKGEKLELN
jgi:hypothetical protein